MQECSVRQFNARWRATSLCTGNADRDVLDFRYDYPASSVNHLLTTMFTMIYIGSTLLRMSASDEARTSINPELQQNAQHSIARVTRYQWQSQASTSSHSTTQQSIDRTTRCRRRSQANDGPNPDNKSNGVPPVQHDTEDEFQSTLRLSNDLNPSPSAASTDD